MAVNYGLLEPVNIAGQFMAGQQQAQQNQLAKQQNEMRQQEFGMRQQEFATQAEDRRLKMDRANERNDFLTKLSDQMQQGGHKLTRETLSSMMNFGLKSNEESLVNLATKGLQALDEQDQFQSEMGKFAPQTPAAPTNALAPAPVAAPLTNAMAGGYTRPQVEQMLISQNARIRDMGKNLFAALPKEVAPKEPPVSIAEFNLAQTDPKFMKFLQDRSAANRAPPAPRPEAAPRTQQITLNDGSLGIVNMDTGVITRSTVDGAPVKGKPSAFAEKTAAQKTQMGKDINFAITQLSDVTKNGGLIDQSTGSGAGRLVDLGAGFVGQATKGAIAIGKIAPIADLVLKMIPRFEGPQSNKDTQSYKEAAGQLADPTLPTEIRKEAGKTVLRLMQERQNQFVSSDMAAETAAPAASSGEWKVVK